MEFYGISGKANSLIKSYLQDRYQTVLVDLDSKKILLRMGICYRWSSPGVLTWSLLFLLYINDIPNIVSDISNTVLYEDYTGLIITNYDSQIFEKEINTAILQLNR